MPPIEVSVSGSVMLVNLLQFLNVYELIVVTPDGIVMLVNALQPENADVPIV